MFRLMIIEKGGKATPYTVGGQEPRYPDGKEAGDAARLLSQTTGLKLQPRRVENEGPTVDWEAREKKRFENGEYKPLPDWFPHEPEHYAHHAVEKGGMVSFTAEPEHGIADKQTRIKPGVYLQRYFSELGELKIQELARQFGAEFETIEFLLAKTPKKIRWVYENGPDSCMSHKASHFNTDDIHPVEAYGAGDLAIAYLTGHRGKPTARCLCWPEKKIYASIYGDSNRLTAALEKAGYSYSNSGYKGARMLIHKATQHERLFILPFFDIQGRLGFKSKRKFVITNGGGIVGNSTGYGEDNRRECHVCHEMSTDYTVVRMRNSRRANVCSSCVPKATYSCPVSGWQLLNSDERTIEIAPGRRSGQSVMIAEWVYQAYRGYVCAGSGLRYIESCANDHQRVEMHDGTVWSLRHYHEHGFFDHEMGAYFPDTMRHTPGVNLTTAGFERREARQKIRKAMREREIGSMPLFTTTSTSTSGTR